jgi:hypothetical protein
MSERNFYGLTPEQRDNRINEEWKKFWSKYQPAQVDKKIKSEPLSNRFPPSVYFDSAEQVVEGHKQSIAKFDIESLTDDIRSFGQSEFERGIEFTLKQLNK